MLAPGLCGTMSAPGIRRLRDRARPGLIQLLPLVPLDNILTSGSCRSPGGNCARRTTRSARFPLWLAVPSWGAASTWNRTSAGRRTGAPWKACFPGKHGAGLGLGSRGGDLTGRLLACADVWGLGFDATRRQAIIFSSLRRRNRRNDKVGL